MWAAGRRRGGRTDYRWSANERELFGEARGERHPWHLSHGERGARSGCRVCRNRGLWRNGQGSYGRDAGVWRRGGFAGEGLASEKRDGRGSAASRGSILHQRPGRAV